MTNVSQENSEIMRIAQRLVKTKGDDSLEYTRSMARMSEETSDVNNQAFWESIARRVELMLYNS